MNNFLIAIQFLTRIPIPTIEFNEKYNFVESVKYYPLVGSVIGFILASAYFLLAGILPAQVLAVTILILSILVTGGLHLDGFMDTVDGLMSAREKEQMLEIMKDSRVGAHSVWAIVCLMLLKFAVLSTLSPKIILVGLLIMPIISRWQVPFSMAFWPYAREKGLGKLFLEKSHSYSFFVNGLVIFLLVYWFAGLMGLISLAASTLVTGIINNYIVSKLNGLTGDTYGAVIELNEVTFLFMFLLLIN